MYHDAGADMQERVGWEILYVPPLMIKIHFHEGIPL
jgi:hypothetical protein